MLGLAVLAAPRDDEDLLGFLCRTAQLNGLTSVESLRSFRRAAMEDVASWTVGTGRPMVWAIQSAELRNPSARPARVWTYRTRKFCPLCLDEASYWRAAWSLMLVTCCVRHNSWLLDRCGACGATVAVEAMGHFRCTNCGAPLLSSSANPSDVSRGALWVSRQLALRISEQSHSTGHVTAHLALKDFHEVALRIGMRTNVVDRKKPLRLREAGTLPVARPIAEGAGNALMAWPKGFFGLLDTIRNQRAPTSNWGIRISMGPIYQDIYRHFDDPKFDFIRQAFVRYVHERWDAPLARRNRNLGPQIVDQHQWVSVSDAAAKVGVEAVLLRRMGKRQEVPSRELTTASGRCARVVNLSAVMESAVRMKEAMTLEQAAVRLGIGEQRVRQLLDAGLLAALGGTPGAGERWWIDSVSVEQCAKCGRQIFTQNEHSVSIAHVAKYRISGGDQFVAMMLAVQSGQLSVWVPPRTSVQIGRWLLSEQEVASWKSSQEKKRPAKLSVVAAALQLGIKQEVAYALVRAGILPAVAEKIGCRTTRWVGTSALNQFQKRYILGSELALLSKTSPKQIVQRLGMYGVRPVAGPRSAPTFCRQYIWPRAQSLRVLSVAKRLEMRKTELQHLTNPTPSGI